MKIITKNVFTITTELYTIMVVASDIEEAIKIFKAHRPTTKILSVVFNDGALINKDNL